MVSEKKNERLYNKSNHVESFISSACIKLKKQDINNLIIIIILSIISVTFKSN